MIAKVWLFHYNPRNKYKGKFITKGIQNGYWKVVAHKSWLKAQNGVKMLIEKGKIHLGLATVLKSRSSPICPTLLLSLGRPMMLNIPISPPAMVAMPADDKAIPVSRKSVGVVLTVWVLLFHLFFLCWVIDHPARNLQWPGRSRCKTRGQPPHRPASIEPTFLRTKSFSLTAINRGRNIK